MPLAHGPFRVRARWFALLMTFRATIISFAQTPSPADPAEGIWLGTLGTPPDASALGLTIKRDDQGALASFIYLEQMHYDNLPLGPVKRDGGTYTIENFGLSFAVDGGRITGTQGGRKRPVELQRADRLPVDPPVPVDLPTGPGPRWQTKLGAPVWARAAVRDGLVYVGNGGGVFSALKASDGSFVWSFSAGRGIHGEALVTDDAVFFACDNGFLFRLNRADGKEVWRYDLGDAQVPRILPLANVYDYDHGGPAPVLADGVLFIGSGDGSFHAVDATTGTRTWRIQSEGKIRTTAALQGPHVIFTTLAGLVCMVERATGKEVWKQEGKTPATSDPVVIGDKLISGSRGSVLRALRLDTGAELWRQTYWGSWVESSPVAGDDGLAYIGTSDYRRVTCFDPGDGRVVWRTDVFGWPWGQPVVTANEVFVAMGGTHPYMIRHVPGIAALDRQTGRIKWRWPYPASATALHSGFAAGLALAGDILVIGGLDGTLYGFPLQ